MHIFLTGAVGVGKSTILRQWLSAHPEVKIGGFRTVCGEAGDMGVYLLPADSPDTPHPAANLVGIRRLGGCAEVFDRLGTAMLKQDDCDLVLMDELGFLESNAELFKCRVLELLDGETQVLGVLKAKSTPFLDAVQSHPKVRVLGVTEENREEVLALLSELL